jgi:hypothetical protein
VLTTLVVPAKRRAISTLEIYVAIHLFPVERVGEATTMHPKKKTVIRFFIAGHEACTRKQR